MKFVAYNKWNQLPESASTLFAEAERDSLFFSRVWLESLTDHSLAEHQSIVLACVVDDESVLAVLPMMNSPRDGLSALSNHFTTLFSLLISDDGPHDGILTCLAQGLSRVAVKSIRLDPIDTNDCNMARLCQSMQLCGFESHSYFRFYNWSHPVNGQSFDEYMAERPANIRNMIRRKQRKFEREHAYKIRLYQDVDIGRALADYQAVYQLSWKANEFFVDFTPSLVKRLSELAWLRLVILYVEEKPVAAQIWFVVHGKANIYRLVYDERWKSYSPGSILTQYLMRYVIDVDKVSEIDFLTGNERYKQDWMTVQKERFGVRFAKKIVQKNSFSRMIQSLKSKG
jgi:hypothetical protein